MPETDVVVLGSGAAGLSAALTAGVGGAAVTVLEGSPLFGGTSAVSGGGMWLPGNTLDPSWTDSLAGAKVYLQRLTLGLVPDAIIDRYLAESGRIPDFFAAHSPLTFTADIGRPDYHAPWEGSSLTSRTVFPTPYELPRLGALEPLVRRPGAGGILPIQHSEEQELAASDDPDAINKLIRERLERGIALRGVALVGGLMEGCVAAGVSFVSDTRGRSLVVSDGWVVGIRAVCDGADVEYRARLAVILASDHPSYVIGDRSCLSRLRAGGPALGPDQGDGWVTADTLREVAGKLGIDADGLSEQVRSFNASAVDGVDPVYHRGEKPWEIHYLPGHRTIGALSEGPFVGYRVRAGVFGTRGGPVINSSAQIVDFGNRPIPGLFGAGNVVAHPFASAYPGGGGTLGPAVTFGHVAAKSVLAEGGLSA